MRRKDKRGGKRAFLSAAIALVLVILLTLAGTALRMHSRGMRPTDAFKSFVSDTFSFK